MLYRISPVSIKSVLKSVTNSIYTYPIDIQIHFPTTKENFQSNIFTFNFYFCTTIYASHTVFPKKEEGKRGKEKKKRRNNRTRRPFQYFTIDSHFPLIFLSLSPLSSTQITRQTVNARLFPCHVRWQNRNRINLDPISVTRYRLTVGYNRAKGNTIFCLRNKLLKYILVYEYVRIFNRNSYLRKDMRSLMDSILYINFCVRLINNDKKK